MILKINDVKIGRRIRDEYGDMRYIFGWKLASMVCCLSQIHIHRRMQNINQEEMG